MNAKQAFRIIEMAENTQDTHEIQGVKDTLEILYKNREGFYDPIAEMTFDELTRIQETPELRKRDSKRGVL